MPFNSSCLSKPGETAGVAPAAAGAGCPDTVVSGTLGDGFGGVLAPQPESSAKPESSAQYPDFTIGHPVEKRGAYHLGPGAWKRLGEVKNQ
jgi:hypothetical protein